MLERLGVPFTVRAAHVQEIEQGDPAQVVLENARRKASAVRDPGAEEVVLTEYLERAPKSRRWKVRARVGDRVRWYEDVEEVE